MRPLRRSAAAARTASGTQKQRGRTSKGAGGRGNSGSLGGRSATPAAKRTGSSRRGGATEVQPLAVTVPPVSPTELPATFSAPVRTLPDAVVNAGGAGVAASRGAVTALVQPVLPAEPAEGPTALDTLDVSEAGDAGTPPATTVVPLRAGLPGTVPVAMDAAATGRAAGGAAELGTPGALSALPRPGYVAAPDEAPVLSEPAAPVRPEAVPAVLPRGASARELGRPLGTLPAAPPPSPAAPAAGPSGMEQLGLRPVEFTAVPDPAGPGLPGADALGATAVADPHAGVTLSARLLAAASAPPMPAQPPSVGPADGSDPYGGDADPNGPLPTPDEVTLLRRSLMAVEPVADRATAHFYAVLFLDRPELRGLFPAAMDVQRDRLFRALLAAARTADDIPALSAYLSRLAVVHRKFGVRDEHYPPVGAALLAALERYCGARWDEPTRRAWIRIFGLISRVMIAAAAEDAQHAPAWWQGEVVSIHRRTTDVAVVTLRTDHPYPFRAGQHAQLEVPWWPRVWRHYSLANAPGPAGLLSFHVKAVPAGWVSNALVHHAQPGVRVRLGPPQGGMTVDHDSADPLLLVGGGTGIAPLLALVEDVAAHGGTRKVELFYGARRPRDLYAAAQLVELTRRHSWLSVRTCVSESGADGGLHADAVGRLPEVVAGYGPWDGYRAFVAGPPAMVRRTATALAQAGVPAERVLHDLADLPDESTALRAPGRR